MTHYLDYKAWAKNTWKKAEIHWRDSTKLFHPWNDLNEVLEWSKDDHKNFIISRGFVFFMNKTFVYIALSACFYDGKVLKFGDVLKIPHGCIIKIIYK